MLNQRPHGGTTNHLTNILGLREVSLVPRLKRAGGLKRSLNDTLGHFAFGLVIQDRWLSTF